MKQYIKYYQERQDNHWNTPDQIMRLIPNITYELEIVCGSDDQERIGWIEAQDISTVLTQISNHNPQSITVDEALVLIKGFLGDSYEKLDEIVIENNMVIFPE